MKKGRVRSGEYGVRRENILLLSVLFFLCSLVIGGCAKQEIKNLDAKGVNIICFGDSITFGYGVQRGEDYPTALATLLTQPVLNKGVDGDTTIEALKRLQTDVLNNDPLMVIVEFSGNDFLHKIPMEVTERNIREMVRIIQAQGAMVALVDVSAGIFLQDYRKTYQKLAHQEKAILVPSVLTGIVTNPRLKSDFLHPNEDGYRMIAEKVAQFIKPYLGRLTSIDQQGK